MAVSTAPYVFQNDFRVMEISPKVDNEGTQRERGGQPLWSVRVKETLTDRDGDTYYESYNVSVPSKYEPRLTLGEPCFFEGLVVGAYSGNLWFSAQSVSAEGPLDTQELIADAMKDSE